MAKKNDNLIIGINLGDSGSTGNIMLNSLEYAHNNGPFDVVACIPYETKQINKVKTISFSAKIPIVKQYYYAFLRRLNLPIVNDGNYYIEYTNRLIDIIKEKSSDYTNTIIHMHNMHMCNLNINKFYKWLIKHKNYKVLYTLHDCWTFTGGCYYYDFLGCNEWKNKCKRCPQHVRFSSYQLKKRTRLLNRIKNLTLVPCSQWLDNELKHSKIKNIPSIVNYGETSLQPFTGSSNLRKKLGIENKKVLITVSAYWNEWKGIKYLYQLADKLPNNYVLLVVGGLLKETKNNIIHIPTINDQSLLAEYYSIADVFVSVTQSDNLPLVLMEAQICGLPTVGFGHGGTPEEITEKSGIMVGKDNDVSKLLKAITWVLESRPFKKDDIVNSGNNFRKYESAKRQFDIYMTLVKKEVPVNELKKIGINILKEIHNFCIKNNLRYSLFFGSLLGAIRHNGYIPWDDDIDIAMPRKDYEFLIKHFRNRDYGIMSPYTNKYYYFPWAKAYDKKTIKTEPVNVRKKFEIGFNIDIFPLDYFDDIDDYWTIKKKETILINKYMNCLYQKPYGSTKAKLFIRKLGCKYNSTLLNKYAKKIDCFFTKKRYKGSEKFVANAIYSNINSICYVFSGKLFDNLEKHKFEDGEFLITPCFNEVLNVCYGDYMIPPKKEKQVSHHSYKVYYKAKEKL